MYAYNCETGRGYLTGVCILSNTTARFRDPPHHGLPNIYVGFLTHKSLKGFTGGAMCGMTRGNRCSYSSFPFPTYYPDTGTGSGYPDRTYVGVFGQPILDRLREA